VKYKWFTYAKPDDSVGHTYCVFSAPLEAGMPGEQAANRLIGCKSSEWKHATESCEKHKRIIIM